MVLEALYNHRDAIVEAYGLSHRQRARFDVFWFGFCGCDSERVLYHFFCSLQKKLDPSVLSFARLAMAIMKTGDFTRLDQAILGAICSLSNYDHYPRTKTCIEAFLASPRNDADIRRTVRSISDVFHQFRTGLSAHFDTIRRNIKLAGHAKADLTHTCLDQVILIHWQKAHPPAPVRFNRFAQLLLLLTEDWANRTARSYSALFDDEDLDRKSFARLSASREDWSLSSTASHWEIADCDLQDYTAALKAVQHFPLTLLPRKQLDCLAQFLPFFERRSALAMTLLRILRFQPLQNQIIQQRRMHGADAEQSIAGLLNQDADADQSYATALNNLKDQAAKIREIQLALYHCYLESGKVEPFDGQQDKTEECRKAYLKLSRRKGAGRTTEETANLLEGIIDSLFIVNRFVLLLLKSTDERASSLQAKTCYHHDKHVFWTIFADGPSGPSNRNGDINA